MQAVGHQVGQLVPILLLMSPVDSLLPYPRPRPSASQAVQYFINMRIRGAFGACPSGWQTYGSTAC